MIAKILHGSAFGGLVSYANDPRKGARVVASSDGINLTDNQTITDSFVMQASLSSRTKKPVAHFVLAFSPRDACQLDDQKLEKMVYDYLERMGYDDNQFVAFRHFDKEHPHVHIIVNRVNFQGRCTSDSREKERNISVCRKMTRDYGLYLPARKSSVKENRLRSMDAVRYQVMHCVRESLQSSSTWKEFQDDLALVGIRLRFRYNRRSNGIEGISFSIAKERVSARMRHDVSFSGKQLDQSLTLDRICQKLGNPLAIVHEQAREMYEDARSEWDVVCDGYEIGNIDKVFPDFDRRFPALSKSEMFGCPDIQGDGIPLPSSFFAALMERFDDVADAGNGAFQVGLNAMAEILFQPYMPAISAGGGGGTSSQLGWGDDDRYKRKRNRAVSYGRGMH